MNILVIGDVVGKPGRRILTGQLPSLRKAWKVDFCVANAENAAGGSGITPECANELLAAGIDVLTSGDHVFKKKEVMPLLREGGRLLRPANLSPLAAGRGWGVFDTANKVRVGVINLQGRVFMKPVDCPMRTVDAILRELTPAASVILVDFHAEATAEKVAMGWHLDGRVSAVFGTHTHVQTADERVLPSGTAYITDLGMTGPHDSVIGRRKDRVIEAMITQMPRPFDVARDDVRINGALIEIDAESGRATDIRRITVHGEESA